ncbi:hypothetical protein [Cellulomonas telluris]|uniref:hypothetical protein n=1 Tax=Cellulomonas telluris TaxID=2306636 RepID=UPI0010A75CFB|nr:hypothetical protein [Cellulomonas telluris]
MFATAIASTTGEDVRIAVGDRVVTRTNHRGLRIPGGYVRNGDLWAVIATATDGSIEVERLTRDGHAAHGARVTLPAPYVAEHVDLGYGTTTHRAQGVTVEQGHVLAASGMTRENPLRGDDAWSAGQPRLCRDR